MSFLKNIKKTFPFQVNYTITKFRKNDDINFSPETTNASEDITP
jgi:hypothetical protein